MTLDELEAKGDDDFDFEAAWKAVEPDDVLTLIYTSGTTGPPKGVQITHAQRGRRPGRSFDQIIQFPDGARRRLLPADGAHRRALVHALPADGVRLLDHRAARTRARWSATCPRCGRPGSSRSRASARSSRPAIEAGIEHEQDEQKKQATQWALGVGLKKVKAEQAGEEVPEELAQEYAKADELVLSKIREQARAGPARGAATWAPRRRRAR